LFLNEHSHLVHACDCDPDLLGVHYFWKWALTFLSSGSTAGPTSGATYQRAWWSQGKVNATYILFERAGDKFIGRILAGLNIHQHPFAVLPPRFGVRGAADGVSLFFICFLFIFYMLYFFLLYHSFPLFQEAVMKIMKNVYPIYAGTLWPLIGVLLKCLAVLCLHRGSIIELVHGASGQGFVPCYNSLFRRPIESEARTVGYEFCTDEAFKNYVVTGIPPHVDQLVSMDRLMKEQHSLGYLVKTEHTCLLDPIIDDLDERVTCNGISSNQVCTLLSEFT
jgi:hypothetical protein